MQKVFIIGNGASATREKLGAEIDRADVVVRMNDFQIHGFEEFVGSKTDILFTCRLNEYLATLHLFPEVILCLLMNPLDGVTIPEKFLQSPNISERIDWPEVDHLTRMLRLKENCYPSTGLLCVLKMIWRFEHVHVVGFDNFEGGNLHYYHKWKRKEPPRHDGTREKQVLSALESLGLLTFATDKLKYTKFDGHAPFINDEQ